MGAYGSGLDFQSIDRGCQFPCFFFFMFVFFSADVSLMEGCEHSQFLATQIKQGSIRCSFPLLTFVD